MSRTAMRKNFTRCVIKNGTLSTSHLRSALNEFTLLGTLQFPLVAWNCTWFYLIVGFSQRGACEIIQVELEKTEGRFVRATLM